MTGNAMTKTLLALFLQNVLPKPIGCAHTAQNIHSSLNVPKLTYTATKLFAVTLKRSAKLLTLTAPESSRIIVRALEMRKLGSVTIQLHTTLTYSAGVKVAALPLPM